MPRKQIYHTEYQDFFFLQIKDACACTQVATVNTKIREPKLQANATEEQTNKVNSQYVIYEKAFVSR